MLSTPQASPHPIHGDSPVEIYRPHHDNDPLNLKCYPGEDLKDGQTPKKKKKKKPKSNQNDIENKGEKNQNKEAEKVEPMKDKKKKKKNKKAKSSAGATQEQSIDDISVKVEESDNGGDVAQGEDNAERENEEKEDLRLKSFSKDWFHGKDILDIGCNIGDITIAIAKQFEPRIIIGNDIDNALIKIAKSKCQSFAWSSTAVSSNAGMNFPMSFAVTNGPLAAPLLLQNEENLKFPKNIIFKQENYVPTDEKSLGKQRPMFDTILCLSVTKWVHLNWGDQGLRLMFKKIYKHLRPGGRLILEPQPFASYKKKRKLSEKIRANYEKISFKPEQFIDYLLSDEVGFVAYEVLEEPQHGAPG
ncbi:hypothetical protein QZH41_018635 [Actinostola sp. cb2023]|nr:hypothetical protein QZH41_018635 [Actinostola sp. cb2023]